MHDKTEDCWPTREDNDQKRNVYFIEAVGLDLIKIGFARNVSQRLADLQSASPVELRLLGIMSSCGVVTEREIHRTLASHRVRGEWFSRCKKIEEFLKRLERPLSEDERLEYFLGPTTEEQQASIAKSRAHYKRRRIATARRLSQKNRKAA